LALPLYEREQRLEVTVEDFDEATDFAVFDRNPVAGFKSLKSDLRHARVAGEAFQGEIGGKALGAESGAMNLDPDHIGLSHSRSP
jgi:hypothetical protein